jgi:hypothetical protein
MKRNEQRDTIASFTCVRVYNRSCDAKSSFWSFVVPFSWQWISSFLPIIIIIINLVFHTIGDTLFSLILNFFENPELGLTTKLKNSPTTLVCTICWVFTAEYWVLGQNLLHKWTNLFATKPYCGDSLSLSSLTQSLLSVYIMHDLTFCSIQPHMKALCPLMHLLKKTHHPNRLTRARHA